MQLISLVQINELLLGYQYLVLFPLVVVEGPIVTVITGFLSSLHQFNFLTAYIVIVIADVTGDCFYYALGRWGKDTVIKRWGSYIGLTAKRIARLETHFDRNSGKTLLLGKIMHGVGTSFLVAAGVAKMSLPKFIWYNLLGTIPKSFVLLLIGYYFGRAINAINSYLELLGAIFLGVLIIGLIIYFFYYRNNKSNQL
jgi:membrane protein DedA with SNARE-associated domain